MKVLYIVYWGALEQLGQSLVVPAVKKQAESGIELTLVTFEKPEDLVNSSRVQKLDSELKDLGIEWIPLRYHKTPKIPATAFDVFQGISRSLITRLKGKYDIVHARTFQAGLMGMLLATLLRAKFIFHNEGYYPDEQVDGGFWAKGSKPHRYAKRLENRMYRKSDGVIVLSEASAREIEKISDRVAVVPSCVDLDRFGLMKASESTAFRMVYLGSVGGRYDLETVGRFVAFVKSKLPEVSFQIYSKAEPDLVASELRKAGLKEKDWALEALDYEEVPAAIGKFDAGIHFLKPGIAEHAGSPTKIGEYWAVGLPVVMSPNMGDTDSIARERRVGVVISGEQDFETALAELVDITSQKNHRQLCRDAARDSYGLESGVETILGLYRDVHAG